MAKHNEETPPVDPEKKDGAKDPTVGELQAQIAARDAEIQKLKTPPVVPEPKPDPRDALLARLDAQEKETAKTRERLELQDLASQHGLSPTQAVEIQKLMKTLPSDFKVSEAVTISKQRTPELWNAPDPKAAQGFHGSARPSGGSNPPANPDPMKTMVANAKTATTRLERDSILKNICGAHMAAAQGIQHPSLR